MKTRMPMTMATALVAAAAISTPAMAQTASLTFTGTVSYVTGDTIDVRNPDGSTTSFDAADLPAYRFPAGSELAVTYSFDLGASAFSDSACGGRVQLTATGGGACDVLARVQTPFGQASYGGAGGDSPNFIRGLFVDYDAATGEVSAALPNSGYSVGYLGVNPYFYDSGTGTLSGPTGETCVDAFNCPQGTGIGTLTNMEFAIPIAGDFGDVRPGYDVGYNAGVAGFLRLVGGFLSNGGGTSGGGATPVPEPGMLLLFGAGAGAVFARRRKALFAAR